MEFLSSTPSPKKSSLKQRQLDKRPWDGDECVEPANPEADLFEQEMNAELEDRIQKAEQDSGFGIQSTTVAVAGPSVSGSAGEKFYDSLYFDSDEDKDSDEEIDYGASGSEKKQRNQSQREVKSNDDLMYDPDMDDEDQAWVDNIRKKYQSKLKAPKAKNNRAEHEEQASSSDAVLNCPACFAILCLDCQRHELYRHQYRAMFVMNCDIDHTEKLKFPMSGEKKKKKQKKLKVDNVGSDEELYNPVKCTKCSTQVAVFDKNEVYHFFNVVASHS